MSEFGRTAAENGSRGTDHGTGGLALLAGGAVGGGRIVGDWPSLSDRALYDGRDVLAANAYERLFKAAWSPIWVSIRDSSKIACSPRAARSRRWMGYFVGRSVVYAGTQKGRLRGMARRASTGRARGFAMSSGRRRSPAPRTGTASRRFWTFAAASFQGQSTL